ncbi:ATP-dependent RecD-like DNA helicase [Janthinobacterium sp. MP5059B]|uniref:AAA domain-containing protein n=1 Tax=Janthinobacterium sp. MP5059B TaxID=1766683 RepID=UPI00089316D2|nr:AAA domain-containing protein [Janthinobacterium sp. MP5059B]OEZ45825.1 ATP-dependent RecD-like DNA helicase [Janthinobacterium sp. MP5059B]
MLTQRIARLAERLDLPLPRIAGQTRLGLSDTLRVHGAIPLTCSTKVPELIKKIDPALNFTVAVELLNQCDVWTWFQTKGTDGKFKATAFREPASLGLVQASEGKLPPNDFCVVLATNQIAFACSPAHDGLSLRVFSAFRLKTPPVARLLVTSFAEGNLHGFDAVGFCQMVAAQTRLRACIDPREAVRESDKDRNFISNVRRYLEALRNYTESSAPRARYALADRAPVRLRNLDTDEWPRAFTRAGTRIEIPTSNGKRHTLSFDDISDDGEVLSTDFIDDSEELLAEGELRVKPGDDAFKRMREALDAMAMGKDEAYGRLLEALTRPDGLQEIPRPDLPSGDPQTQRQLQARELALNTPDIALIQGPPGTGKTTVICGIIEELVKAGKRILLVAPTHVALDNVLEGVGDRPGVTAIRLGSVENVEVPAQRFLLQNRSRDLVRRLSQKLRSAAGDELAQDPVARVQREWAERIKDDDEIGVMLLLNANLLCATPIGIAMAREFREVEAVFDVMIMDEASKATLTDFLVPAARARKWILVGDHRQLPPYVDLGELEAVASERAKRADLAAPNPVWIREVSSRLRRHFDERMHPDPVRRERAWRALVEELCQPFEIGEAEREELVLLGSDPEKWRNELKRTEVSRAGHSKLNATLRLGAEMLELQKLALPSVFEHLTKLPASRVVKLNYQHRMAPQLAEFSSELVYDGDYPPADTTDQLGLDIPGLQTPSIWLDTAYQPAKRRYEYPRDTNWTGGNYTNPLEIDVAIELVDTCASWAVQSWRGDLRKRGRGPDATFEIGVVCFYLEQARSLRQAIFRRLRSGSDPWRRQWDSPAANNAPIDIHISIVDRFQGREKDLVILCTTRSNPNGNRGHVDNLNRLNVAVTRARHKRIVIGDSTTLAGQEGGRRRDPGDLLVRLYEGSEQKKKWGRALGGQ